MIPANNLFRTDFSQFDEERSQEETQYAQLSDLAAVSELFTKETVTFSNVLTRKKIQKALEKFPDPESMLAHVRDEEDKLVALAKKDYTDWNRQGMKRYEIRPFGLEGFSSCTALIFKGVVVEIIDNEELADTFFPVS